jgi:hypothetical protein
MLGKATYSGGGFLVYRQLASFPLADRHRVDPQLLRYDSLGAHPHAEPLILLRSQAGTASDAWM